MKNICFLFVFSIVIFYSTLNAQWVQTNLPYSGNITCLATEPNGSGLANGVYYYQLQAGEFVSIKKLILLK